MNEVIEAPEFFIIIVDKEQRPVALLERNKDDIIISQIGKKY